jgi:hypothetical protein
VASILNGEHDSSINEQLERCVYRRARDLEQIGEFLRRQMMSLRQVVLPNVINDPQRDLCGKPAFHSAKPGTCAPVCLVKKHFVVINAPRRPLGLINEARMGKSQ